MDAKKNKAAQTSPGSIRESANRFWAELQRRRVIKTAIAYLIGAWVAVEVSSTLFPLIYLPEWTVRFVVVLAFLGMPIVIVLAWMFDIERKPGLGNEVATPVTSTAGPSVAAHEVPPLLSSAEVSVAVLPFDNVSSSKDQDYMALGIAAELHNTLSRLHRARVVSRRSTLKYAGSAADVRQIGRELNVQFVVSGSVVCSTKTLRVLVQIDDAKDGVQIWAESFDRTMNETLEVQQQIAMAVASAFGGVRLREEIVRAKLLPTDNLSAWSRLQKARSYLLDFSADSLNAAVSATKEAIELDENYAMAHAVHASVLGERLMNGFSPDFASDKQDSLIAAQRAIDLAPDDPFVLKMAGVVNAYVGRTERSLQQLRKAVDIAPFDFGAWGYLGWPLVQTGNQEDIDELQEIMSRLIEYSPGHPGLAFWLFHKSVAATVIDDLDGAVRFARESMEENPRFPIGWYQLANALGASGDLREAALALDQCRKLSPQMDISYYENVINSMHENKRLVAPRLAGILAISGA